jgi:cation-transporting P-type ATPase F
VGTVEELLERHLHALPAEEALALLDSDAKHGLDLFEIQSRQKQFGPNSLPTRVGQGVFLTFLLQFHQPLIYILLIAVGITAMLHEWIDAAVILGVVLVNAIIGFLQESKAAKALDALAKMITTQATVLRSGEIHTIPSLELVPGDIVLLQSGDKVPADVRLFACRDLQIDESTLTGESMPVEKHATCLPRETPLAERANLAFSSTLVTYGQGRGVVFATGATTEVGRISDLVSGADILQTPLTRKIASFSRLLLIAILIMSGLTFVVGILRGETAFDMFMAAVALAVGAIPEGLPAAVTITLAIGVNRMARRKAIIRKLPAVETLGSTTVICSDKTGTLTVNQMTVRKIWAAGNWYEISGSGYAPEGQVTLPDSDDVAQPETHLAMAECLRAGLVCNDSALEIKDGNWFVTGDPTEGALIASAQKIGIEVKQVGAEFPRVDSIPFESQHQYMATLHDHGNAQSRLMYVKGAVEVVLSRCVAMLSSSGEQVAMERELILANVEQMATSGMRVLAFARGEMDADKSAIAHGDVAGLVFLGLQGMIDPARPEAIEAVSACQKAGIRVKMITGDHPITARAIAEKLGLNNTEGEPEQSLQVMTSQELSQMSDRELIEVAERVSVFARATPEQKLRLVRALQANGHVVAMTGDGVNDSPALKQADIGIAMGMGGTEVAKEASDMILTDDNFATIEAAVEEGRGVFDNLTKFIVWTLPTNMGEGLVILAAIFAGATLPLLPIQILWINMTTAVLLGLMLAFEPKEPDIMNRTPRNPQEPLLNLMLIGRLCIVSLILLAGAFGSFQWSLENGYSNAAARTVAVNVFVTVELCYLFNCRSLTKSMFEIGVFSNRWIAVGVSTMILLQLAFTYAPFMNRLFQSAPIGWDAWWRILLTGLVAYSIVGGEKWLRRKWAARRERQLA